MKENIAEPYCDWTLDEDAKSSSVFLLRAMFSGIAVFSFIASIILYPVYENVLLFIILFVTFFVSAIVGNIVRSNMASAKVHSSNCRKSMRYVQYNYPVPKDHERQNHTDIIYGENGRVYITAVAGSSPAWFRMMQSLRVCDSCKRYVILQKKKLIPVGGERSHVDVHERQQQANHKAVARMRKKRLKG